MFWANFSTNTSFQTRVSFRRTIQVERCVALFVWLNCYTLYTTFPKTSQYILHNLIIGDALIQLFRSDTDKAESLHDNFGKMITFRLHVDGRNKQKQRFWFKAQNQPLPEQHPRNIQHVKIHTATLGRKIHLSYMICNMTICGLVWKINSVIHCKRQIWPVNF